MIESRLRRFLAALFPALLAPLQLLLFGPHTLFMANQQEFTAPFSTFAVHLVPAALLSGLVLAAIGAILPKRFFAFYCVGLAAIGVVAWAQGNLMVGDYGVLNGQDIEWSGQDWRNRFELPIWVGVPVIAIAAARYLLPAAVFASRVLIALQAVLLVVTAYQTDPEAQPKWQGPPDAIFELSSKQNVFHFVLDGFQSDALRRHPPR